MVHSVINNYSVLQELWDSCLETRLQPDIRSRVIGVQAQMKSFEYFFGVVLGERILKHADNLSKTLQHKNISVTEAQSITSLTVKTLQLIRNDNSYELFWELLLRQASQCNIAEPVLPRRRKVPKRFEHGTAEAEFPSSPKSYYKRIYFEALDLVINCVTNRFNQPGYIQYKKMEELLTLAANGKDFKEKLKAITDFYLNDFNNYKLDLQLNVLSSNFKDKHGSVSFIDVKEYLTGLTSAEQIYYSEVITLLKLILVQPATNATSERTFSAMTRVTCDPP